MNRRNFQHRFKAPQVKGKNTIAIVFLAFAFSILSGLMQAQTLGVYAFTGSNGCNSVEVTTQPSNATFGSYSSVNTACENTSNIFKRDQWNTSGTINTAEYNQFSITPSAGYVLNLTNITFTQEMSYNNSTTWALRSSVDNYASNIATGTATTSSQTPSITLSGFTNLGATTFRLYIINANSSLTDWSNDNVTLSGTVTSSCTTPAAPGTPTSNSPQCSSSGVTITKSGSAPSGITWYWQGTNSAGTSTAQNATSTYNATTSGTYYVRAQDNAGLCWSASSGSIAVTVNPQPTITLGSNPAVCIGTTTANLTYSATTDSPDLYSIDYDATAEAAGFTDVVNATLPGTPIVLVVPSGAATGTYNYTVSVKNNTTGCVGTGVAKTITINALPTITLGSNPTVCSGSTSANLSYSATTDSPDKYSIDYDATAEAAGFTDVVNAALPSSPIVIIVPAGAASGTYNYNVSVKNNTTGCVGTSTAKTITLTPAPSITLGSDPSVCSGITTANLTYSSTNNSPDQYSINYDAAAEAAGFTDVVNAALPSSPIALVVPSGAAAATYNYTVSVKNTTTGCTSSVTSKTITVNPAPTITLGSNPSVCLGTTTANLTFSATTQSPEKYSIDYDATAEAEGFTDIVNAALPASPIVLTVPSAPAPGTYNFTVTVKNNTTGCTGIAIGKTISIAAPSTVTPGGPDIALQSASPSPITLSGASIGGSATTAAWSITSGGGTLSSTSQASSPQTVTYTPAANYTGAVVLTLTTNAGICSAASGTRTITVNPATVQTFTTTTNFTIPACVSEIIVEAWGAGGGAGGSNASNGGSGGGGGAYSSKTVSVTPQTTYSVHVGTAGAGGTPNNPGAAGGDSWFNNSSTVLAKGGSGGGASAGAVGVGGNSGAGVGTTLFSGGNGGLGNGSGGGGGGSSAGTAANGNNGNNMSSGGAGGVAPTGGGAGANGNTTTNGHSATALGGGGAGGDDESDVSGGAGFRGQIILRWTASLSIGNNPVAAADVCANTSNVPLHSFSLQGDNSSVTDVNFVTTGNYSSAEISNFKLYYTTSNTFSTSNLLSTITSPTTAGTQTFPAFSLSVGAGSNKYLWITMDVASTVTNGHTIAVTGTSPSNITASVIATSSSNASGTQTLNQLPTISVNSTTICLGESATLTATGGATYLWSTGATTDAITVTPTSNISYSVSGTTTGCSASAIANVTVNESFIIYGEVTDVNCVSNTLGSISLNPMCGTAPYSFLWSNGSTTQNLTNVTEGIYEVRVTDNVGTFLKKQFIVYTCTQWTDTIDVDLSSNTLTKTSSDGWANAGAKSKNLIYQNDAGAIKYVVEDLTKSFVVGLSEEEKYDLLITNTTSAFAIKQDTLKVFIHGVLTNSYGGILQGDKIELVQSPQSITFYKNDDVLFTVDSSNQAPLKVDFIPYKQNSSVSDIKSSFGLPQFFFNTQLLNDTTNGIANLDVQLLLNSNLIRSSISGKIDTLDLPIAFTDSILNFAFNLSRIGIRDTKFNCTTSKYGTVKSLSFYDDSLNVYIPLDSTFYQVSNGSELIMIPVNRSVEELPSTIPIYLNLEGNLVLSPNGDGNFDYLTLVGAEKVETFDLVIRDVSNTEVFHSTQKNFQWDGNNYSSNIVIGTYYYTMIINGQAIAGVMLIDF